MAPPFETRPITPVIGAEVTGVDLAAAALDDTFAESLRRAFLEHHALVFRDQRLDREQHKAIGRLFGGLDVHPSRSGPGVEDPEVFVVRADERTVLNNGGLWHTDLSCYETPPIGSALLLRTAPPSGGDTPVASHPVVIAHPETGRPALFVNRAFTTCIGQLGELESRRLLEQLFDHIAGSPNPQCRVRWEPGTLVLWDNRSCQHDAVWDYRPHVRKGERVTIAGAVRPVAARAVA